MASLLSGKEPSVKPLPSHSVAGARDLRSILLRLAGLNKCSKWNIWGIWRTFKEEEGWVNLPSSSCSSFGKSPTEFLSPILFLVVPASAIPGS
jgi:hypothetical protein